MGRRRYRLMEYVYPRPDGRFEIRYPIPADVRKYYPKGDGSKYQSHIIRSLGTSDREEANRRAVVKFAELERKFSVLREGAVSPHFAEFLRRVFDRELERGRIRRATSILSIENLDFELKTMRHALSHPEPGELMAIAGWVVDEYFAIGVNAAAHIPSDTDLSDALLAAAGNMLFDVYMQLSAEAKGMVVAPKRTSAALAEAVERKPVLGQSLALSSEGKLPVSKYWDVYVGIKQGSSAPVAKHTLERRETAWKELCDLLGAGTKLFEVTKADIWRYRDALMKAPAYAGSIRALRDLSFTQRIEAVTQNPGKYQSLDLNSVGDRLRQINAVFAEAEKRGHLDRNPAQGVSESKKTSEKARSAYSDDELQLIFSTAPFDRPVPLELQSDEYWVPLLQLFMGARASELYLRTSDVVLDHPIPHIRLVEFEERTLKNASSARAIPIHPQLIELGFLEYCRLAKARGPELFPAWEFRKGQKPSEGAGRRRFNRHLRNLMPNRTDGFPADSHTFRHNFESALMKLFAPPGEEARGVVKPDENRIAARLTGRAFNSSAETYTHDLVSLPDLAAAIAKVCYPGLSLKHLVSK